MCADIPIFRNRSNEVEYTRQLRLSNIRRFSTQNVVNKQSSLALRAISAVCVSGAALFVYFNYEQRQAKAKSSRPQAVGQPLVGGPFALVNHFGKPVTHALFDNQYTIVYFGYTFCPDVCPEELEKIAAVVDTIGNYHYHFIL